MAARDRGDDLFATADAVDLYRERIRDPRLFPGERKSVDRYFEEGGSVLDVGCGAGRVAHLLAERGFDVTGIDVSEPLVAEARSLFPEIDFRVADIRDAPFPAESFDHVVFSFFGLDYVLPKRERVAALAEIRRLLRPSGVFVFSSHNSWHPLVPLGPTDLHRAVGDVVDLYLREKNRDRIGSRYKVESAPLGEIEIYLSNPAHQWLQLHECGFSPLDVVGERDGLRRFFERQPHYVAKK
ncbi:MAG: class I SAM-dependent methyltransferase [Halosimplex sp.]